MNIQKLITKYEELQLDYGRHFNRLRSQGYQGEICEAELNMLSMILKDLRGLSTTPESVERKERE